MPEPVAFRARRFWARQDWHGRYLRACYAWVHQHHWRSPSSGPPRALLCGTGAAETTAAFVAFWSSVEPRMKFEVVDLDPTPLEASEQLLGSREDVRYTVADAARLPFDRARFHLIETDFLLQFIAPDTRAQVFVEWARVLHPEGLISTRDYVRRSGGRLERAIDGARRAVIERSLRTKTFALDEKDLNAAAAQAGLKETLAPLRLAGIRVPLFTSILARHQAAEDSTDEM